MGTSYQCGVCKKEFALHSGLLDHLDEQHAIRIIQEEPLILRIDSERADPIKRFAAAGTALRMHFPGKRFQIVPGGGKWTGDQMNAHGEWYECANIFFTSWFAVEEPEVVEKPEKGWTDPAIG